MMTTCWMGLVAPGVERSGMATRVSDKPSRTPTRQAPIRITIEKTVSPIRALVPPRALGLACCALSRSRPRSRVGVGSGAGLPEGALCVVRRRVGEAVYGDGGSLCRACKDHHH